MGLRLRLALVLVLVNAVVLGLLAVWTAELERDAAEQRERRADTLQAEIASLVSLGFEAEDVGDLGRMLSWPLWREFEDAVILDTRLIDLDGALVPVGTFLNPRGSRGRVADFPMAEVTRAVASAAAQRRPVPVAGGLAVPLDADGPAGSRPWGGVFVRLLPPESPVALTRRLLATGILATLGGLVLVFLLVDRTVLKPVLDLSEAAHTFGAGGAPQLRPAPSPEVRDLQQSFESMMTRIRGFQQELEREVEAATARAGEAERRAARQDRLAAMGMLAAGLAHEINSPLAGALHGMEVLRAETAGERGTRYTQLVGEALERIRGLVQRLLQMAPREVADGSCALEDVAADLSAFLGSRLERHTLSVELPEGGLRVRGARGDLFPVLLNLVQNALDSLDGRGGRALAEPRPGQVTLRGERRAEGGVRILVRDDGPGAAPEVLRHLFEPFVTSKDPGVGTGLGLALAHAVVRQLGGSIEARNLAPRGFEVEIRLSEPLEDADAGAPRAGSGR